MKRISILVLATATAACIAASVPFAAGRADDDQGSPIFGVKIPAGYRQWEMVGVSQEVGLGELRGILGNDEAIKASQGGALPFPDGTMFVKLAWKHVASPDFDGAFVPGPTTKAGVQIMVKDSKKYATTGGWGFGRFIDGKPADLAQHETCFPCHQAHAKGHDYVFSRFAP
jgi:hypothetical protein